jgi:formamidopyrimidine-DNA glycosylase
MPELPEIRALAERLNVVARGAQIHDLQILSFSGLKTVSPTPSEVTGATVTSVSDIGKFLVLELSTARALVHLGNAGRVEIESPPKSTRRPGSLVRIRLDEFALLVYEFGKERRAGLWLLPPGDEGPLATLGPDPFSEEFAHLLRSSDDHRQLHGLLRDQHTVRGIGRGYADDILNAAGLSPFAKLSGLTSNAREELLGSVRTVLSNALDRERTRTGGLSDAKLGDRFAVHRRAGHPCPRCGRILERISYSSHEVVYCPHCQTRGKVLADRRISRLVK